MRARALRVAVLFFAVGCGASETSGRPAAVATLSVSLGGRREPLIGRLVGEGRATCAAQGHAVALEVVLIDAFRGARAASILRRSPANEELVRGNNALEPIVAHVVMHVGHGSSPHYASSMFFQSRVLGGGTHPPATVSLPPDLTPFDAVTLEPGESHSGWVVVWLPRSKPGEIVYWPDLASASSCTLALPAANPSEVEPATENVRADVGPTRCFRPPPRIPAIEYGEDGGLGPLAGGIIDAVVEVLGSCAGAHVTLAGHSDAVGAREARQDRSLYAATLVRSRLIDRGVGAQLIETCGWGDVRPLETNATPLGRQLNRRVEIVVTLEDTSLACPRAGRESAGAMLH